MDDEFLKEFFDELNREFHNKQFISELQEQIVELDKIKVEDLIKKYF